MAATASAHQDTFVRDNLRPQDEWPDLVLDLPDVQYPPQLNCGHELLDATIEEHGADRPCLLTPDETWSCGETRERVDHIAHVLVEDFGVVPGNRVLLRGPNNAWLAACWLAVMKAGAVAVTTMPLLRAKELREIAREGQVGAALCDHRFLDDLEAADAGIDIVAFGGDGPDDLARRMERHPATFDAVPTAADDPALIAFTSGTTGKPKGCVSFQGDVLATADTFSEHVIKPRPDDIFTGSPPLGFTFGLGQLLIFPLRAGADGVPRHAAGRGPRPQLPAPGRVRRRDPAGAHVGAVQGADRCRAHRRHRVDRDAARVHLGLRRRHPARCDEEGYFWFQARTDDLIVSSGYNIAGPEVEQALLTHPDVAEVAVVGEPDEDRGQIVAAFTVLREGVEGDDGLVRTLQDHVKQAVAPYKYPRAVHFIDELPRTQTGKVQRFRLREQSAET